MISSSSSKILRVRPGQSAKSACITSIGEPAAPEFGRLLIGEPVARGRGLGLEATHALLEYGFGPLGLKQIRLEVLAHNIRAIAIYHRCGFQPSSHEPTDGLLTMALSREDWIARQGPKS